VIREFVVVDTWRHVDGHFQYLNDDANAEDAQQISDMQTAIRNLAPFWQSVRVLQIESTRASRLFEDASLAFVYLDARHDYCSVVEDVETWWPKLKPGGLLAGDDYGDNGLWAVCGNGSTIEGAVKRAIHDIQLRYTTAAFATFQDQWLLLKPDVP